MTDVRLEAVQKSFGNTEVVHGVDIDIKDGEFVVFVGPSGCGKSTLLRMIAGLEEITAGDLYIDGAHVNNLAPAERGIAMVFQSYALYPHMSVYKNMSFGLSIAKIGKAEADKRVRQAADILQLTELLDRRPAQLSGGQRQRVAIGRAIVRDPGVFLFDEPLSNLDAALRVNTRLEIAKLHQDLKNTVIYVTHDQVEAMTLADKIVVLNEGNVEQIGSPLELYNNPANTFVAGFIGSPKMNFLSASGAAVTEAGLDVATGADTLGIRPEHIHARDGDEPALGGRVEVIERLGDVSYVYVTLSGGERVVMAEPGSSELQPGDTVNCRMNTDRMHLFDADGASLPT